VLQKLESASLQASSSPMVSGSSHYRYRGVYGPLVFIVAFAATAKVQAASTGPRIEMPPVTVEAGAPGLSPGELERYRLESAVPQVRETRETFERLPNDRASDVIGRLPGVVLSGPPGEKKAISLRGLTPDFNRVEVNGVQLPSSSQSRSFELMNLPSFLVNDITIIRNPSAEYEADGISGRIAVNTRNIPSVPTFEARAAFGGVNEHWQDNWQASVGYGQRFHERFGIMGAVNYDRRLIMKEKDFSERTFSGGPGGQGFLRDEFEPKVFQNIDLLLDAAYFYDGGEIHTKPLYLYESTDLDKRRDQYRRVSEIFQDRTLTTADERTETVGLTVEQTHRFSAGPVFKANASYFHTDFDTTALDTTYNSALNFANASAEDNTLRDESIQAGANLALPFHAWAPQELKFGLAFRRNDRSSDRNLFTVDARGERSQSPADLAASLDSDYALTESYYAAFVQNRLAVAERLSLTPGVRLEYVVDHLRSRNLSRRPEFTDVLPSLPVLFRATEHLAFHGAVSRQVNRPKFDEIAPGITRRGPRQFIGNPDLVPAKSWSVDLGSSYVSPNIALGINLYYRLISDLIETTEIATNTFTFRNVGDGYARGIELDQRFRLAAFDVAALDGFSFKANQAFIDTEVDDPQTGKRRFADQPRFVGNFGLEWARPPTGTLFSLVLNYTSSRLTVSHDGSGNIRRKTRQGEVFLDFYAEQDVYQGLKLFVSAENLTNQKRDEEEFVNGALDRQATIESGRVFYLGMKFRF
jgi:outer membrane receptor for ferrienterochelin and colicins